MAKARTKTRSTTYGIYGHGFLAMLYRYGALTHVQLEILGDLGPSAVDRQLKPLMRSGRVVKAGDKTLWDAPATGAPKALYHLSVPVGAKAGARALGEDNDRSALRDYRRIKLPDTVVHRVECNEYLISLQAIPPEGARVPFESVFSESNPDFPLFGSGRPKSERKDAPYRYTAIVPDAVFGLEFGSGDKKYTQHYHLELESELRKKKVLEKVRDYMGRWRRLVKPNAGEVRFHDPEHRLEPLVVLSRTIPDFEKLHEHLKKQVPELEDYEAAREALWKASGGSVSPLDMVLLAPHGVAVAAPQRSRYKTLAGDKSVNSSTVSLVEASERAGKIELPNKKSARTRAVAEQEAAEAAAEEAAKEAEKASKKSGTKTRRRAE